MVLVEIITSEGCGFCPIAIETCRKVVQEFPQVQVKEISTSTKEGMRKSKNLDITTVPTILINGEIRFHGVPRESLLRSAIKKVIEEEKK